MVKFGTKLAVLFVVVVALTLYFAWDRMSFDEARAQAARDWRGLDVAQTRRLAAKKARFTEQAVPACLESSRVTPDNFVLIVEIGSDGRVARSWRQQDSRFMTCIQRLMNEYFEFRGLDRSIYVAYEYLTVQ